MQSLTKALGERQTDALDQQQWQITRHPQVPDVLLVNGRGPVPVDFTAAAGREVSYGYKTPGHVSNGLVGNRAVGGNRAQVFVPGVLGCSPNVQVGDQVVVSVAVEPAGSSWYTSLPIVYLSLFEPFSNPGIHSVHPFPLYACPYSSPSATLLYIPSHCIPVPIRALQQPWYTPGTGCYLALSRQGGCRSRPLLFRRLVGSVPTSRQLGCVMTPVSVRAYPHDKGGLGVFPPQNTIR
eukprot:4765740-Pyramimonas_sp.AAC.1